MGAGSGGGWGQKSVTVTIVTVTVFSDFFTDFSVTFLGVFRAGAEAGLEPGFARVLKISDLFVFRDGAGGQAALKFSVPRRWLSYRLALQVAGGGLPAKPQRGAGSGGGSAAHGISQTLSLLYLGLRGGTVVPRSECSYIPSHSMPLRESSVRLSWVQ